MGAELGDSCNTYGRSTWTGCYALTWASWLVGAIAYHVAINNLLGPIGELRDNLRRGFYQELGFEHLAGDSQTLKEQSFAALQICGASAQQCQDGNLIRQFQTADTTAQRNAIQRAFDNSLRAIEKVSADKYLGTQALQPTADNLHDITKQLENLDSDQCRATNLAYCKIFLAAGGLVTGTQQTLDELNSIIESKEVLYFEDNSDGLMYLHGLPFSLLLSKLFFFCFWKTDAACYSCGGSFVGCILLVAHIILWLVAFIVSAFIVEAALSFERIPMEQLEGKPTAEELLDHIELTFQGLWKTAIVPLESPLTQFFFANLIFVFACITISVYGLCTCLCRPYVDKESAENPSRLCLPRTPTA